ncbi:MAG: hypothetical protein KF770_32280, partial [Anaerolineae bacterium]|nr:hypothetical protein [Anaerolineae bacterium]
RRVERGQNYVPFFVTHVPFSVAQVVKNGTGVKWGSVFCQPRFVCCSDNDKKRHVIGAAFRFLPLSKTENS